MRIVFTETAAEDLAEIREFLASNYPVVAPSFERRIAAVLAHIAIWPDSTRAVTQRPSVRVAPLIRYPYKIFYRVVEDMIEVIHIRHVSRREWEDLD